MVSVLMVFMKLDQRNIEENLDFRHLGKYRVFVFCTDCIRNQPLLDRRPGVLIASKEPYPLVYNDAKLFLHVVGKDTKDTPKLSS
jgi:hypothetical protein